jgi:KaiC/GvpD/RAD55 family RecA-like ATPase
MIKEVAFGLDTRHYFEESNAVFKFCGSTTPVYTSLYNYDENVREYVRKNKTLSGYDGNIYMPDEFVLDVDVQKKNTEFARQETIALILLLEDMDVPYRVYFSGRGFHLGIPAEAFKWEGSPDLNLRVKDKLTKSGIYEYADPSVIDKTRLIRLVNTRNTKTGLFKIQIDKGVLESDVDTIYSLARNPKEYDTFPMECRTVWDLTESKIIVQTRSLVKPESHQRMPDKLYYPCIQKMLEDGEVGSRHQQALRIAAHLRWRYPESVVSAVMEDWRIRNNPDTFPQEEMVKIVDSCYTGHNGDGIRYGCNDILMDKFCSSSCRLYRSKKNQSLTLAEDLEREFITYVQSNDEPVDIGLNMGFKYPIHKGEFVIVIAPPKSMKTTLIQNWITLQKKPTYFLEMEMSKRQIWNTFMQIETGLNEEELYDHYIENASLMANKFSWLSMDFNRCYAHEIRSKISSMPIRPEIVVIDHMHRFLMKGSDIMHNMSEVSRELTDLAIRENLIVIAIAEMDKTSIREKQFNMGFKGGVDAVYDANKVIGITSVLRNKEGLIEMLGVKSIVNREKEHFDTLLTVKNKRVFKEE